MQIVDDLCIWFKFSDISNPNRNAINNKNRNEYDYISFGLWVCNFA